MAYSAPPPSDSEWYAKTLMFGPSDTRVVAYRAMRDIAGFTPNGNLKVNEVVSFTKQEKVQTLFIVLHKASFLSRRRLEVAI